MYPRESLKNTIQSPYDVTSYTSTALVSWTWYPDTLFLPQELWFNFFLKNIEYGIKQVNSIYLQRGFKIARIHTNIEFEPLRSEMADIGIYLYWAPKKEHVTDIEQFNQTTKEHVWSSRSAITFKRIYKLMIVHLVTTDIFWLNTFPTSKHGAGLSNTKAPKKLVLWKCCVLQEGFPPLFRRIFPGTPRGRTTENNKYR